MAALTEHLEEQWSAAALAAACWGTQTYSKSLSLRSQLHAGAASLVSSKRLCEPAARASLCIAAGQTEQQHNWPELQALCAC